MGAHRKTQDALERMTPPVIDLHTEYPLSMLKLAAGPPFPPPPPAPFKKDDPFTNTKRNIPADHKFDPKALKPMSKMLWAMAVSLGHALQAYRQFTRLKSITISPDGLVGGRGYVMGVKDVRAKLYEACEALSAISDTIHDEINAPYWKPKLGELEKKDVQEISKFVGEAEEILGDPEGEAEDEMEEVEDKKKWSPSRFQEEAEQASKMPTGGDADTMPSQGPHPAAVSRPEMKRQASAGYSYDRRANSSVNPDELPGPRVDHLDRAEDGRGPFDSYNDDEKITEDDWGETEGVGGEYNYPSPWDNNLHEREAFGEYAESALPSDSDTRTEGWDFGIGYGEGNDAHGQGAGGYGEGNPSSGGKGVNGPRANLPDDPGAPTRDLGHSDSNPSIDVSLNNRDRFSGAELPGDADKPVARSDYFAGPKGNDFDGVVSESAMPGDDSGNPYDSDRGTMDTGYKHEQGDTPYVKWDDSTHNMRPDPVYQRGPVQGPYVKQ